MKKNTFGKLVLSALCGVLFCLASVGTTMGAVSSLASTGLLAKPDESAEEILLRAHRHDPQAIILAVIGYFYGIGGFPQNPFLASGWNFQLAKVNDVESMSLLTLMMLRDENFPDEDFGGLLAMCPHALTSKVRPVFQKEGLFDVQRFCQALERKKGSFPGWEKRYAETAARIETSEKQQKESLETTRAFRDEPCSARLADGLRSVRERMPWEDIPFYAATTHDLATERPEWSAEHLLRFLDKLNACARPAHEKPATGGEKGMEWVVPLAAETAAELLEGLSLNEAAALSAIHSAHDIFHDNQDAVRAMAANYRFGNLGFPQSDVLADLWLQHAAFGFDNESRLMLTIRWFAEKRHAEAWAWATVIGKDREAATETKRLARQLRGMIEVQAGKGIAEQGSRFESAYFQATNAWIDWLAEQRAGVTPPSSP